MTETVPLLDPLQETSVLEAESDQRQVDPQLFGVIHTPALQVAQAFHPLQLLVVPSDICSQLNVVPLQDHF